MSKKITVKAGPGVHVFFPRRVISAPGARVLSIKGDTVAIVAGDDRFVLKRIKVGDLVVVKQTAMGPAKAASKASETAKKSEK